MTHKAKLLSIFSKTQEHNRLAYLERFRISKLDLSLELKVLSSDKTAVQEIEQLLKKRLGISSCNLVIGAPSYLPLFANYCSA
jgi:hypothetical protein